MTALAHDIGKIESTQKRDFTSTLVAAARASGRSPVAIALDFYKLKKRQGRLRFYEYFLYALYDTNRWSEEERNSFISAHLHWPVSNACNDTTWWAVTEDKWLSSAVLRQNGLPVPRNAAVFDTSPRAYPDVPKLTNAKDLKEFLSGDVPFPLFAKPITGMWSAGAIRITGCTDTHILVAGQQPMTFEEFTQDMFGNQSYLIQDCLTPHPFFHGLTDAIATVRCVNFIDDTGLCVPYTLLKLPQQGNVADNFWRSGNLVCDLDPENGMIRRIAMTRDGQRVEMDHLPDARRALVGETLPDWDQLRQLNERVALLHSANRYGSTDIALTPDGPVVVEVNTGCAFELVQIATGKGMLTPDILSFFRRAGAKI